MNEKTISMWFPLLSGVGVNRTEDGTGVPAKKTEKKWIARTDPDAAIPGTHQSCAQVRKSSIGKS